MLMTQKIENSPFEEIIDSDIIRDVFGVAFKKSLPIKFWLKNKIVHFDACITAHNKERVFIDLPPSVGTEVWDKAINELRHEQFYLFGNVQIQKTTFFIKFIVSEREHRTIKLYRPNIVYKLQRRQDTRVRISFANKIHAVMEDPLAPGTLREYRLMDLSAGGMSLAIGLDEGNRFTKDKKIENISFRLLGRDLTCDAVVKHVVKIKDEAMKDVLKCGIQFTKVPTTSEAVIQNFVDQEIQSLFSTI